MHSTDDWDVPLNRLNIDYFLYVMEEENGEEIAVKRAIFFVTYFYSPTYKANF